MTGTAAHSDPVEGQRSIGPSCFNTGPVLNYYAHKTNIYPGYEMGHFCVKSAKLLNSF